MDMLDHKNAISEASYKELRNIDGGLSISGTLINAFANGIKTVFDIGRSLGNSIRRLKEDKLCEIS